MRSRTQHIGRRGTTLVYFAMIGFALLGVAALVLDTGFALVTRQKLQSAADTAALEGLRQRDVLADADRRQAVSDLVSALFDDNLNPNDADTDPRAFSAGPVVDFSGGLQFGAAQTSTVGAPYLPRLQLNLTNDQTGDMVAGTFDPSAAPGENNDYSRADFTADPAGNAFLVRLRRTGETFDSGVGSAGPALPYLFARGSFLSPQLKTTGILVRGTAIANARPVLTVGNPNPDPKLQLPGVTPFFLLRGRWEDSTLPVDTAVAVAADPNGGLTVNGTPVGNTFTPSTATISGRAIPVLTFGQAAVASNAPLVLSNALLLQYVPIVDTFTGLAGTSQRIIGFGRVDVANNAGQLMITKRQNKIAPTNASAALLADLDAGLQADPTLLSAVTAANLTFGQPLLAPALVR